MTINRNDKDVLNYQPARYNPIDDFSKWYEENGKHNVKKEKSTTELATEQIEKGNLENVPSILKIAYGLEQLQKAKEAEQAKRNKDSDQ
jgi:hypothetical protein